MYKIEFKDLTKLADVAAWEFISGSYSQRVAVDNRPWNNPSKEQMLKHKEHKARLRDVSTMLTQDVTGYLSLTSEEFAYVKFIQRCLVAYQQIQAGTISKRDADLYYNIVQGS